VSDVRSEPTVAETVGSADVQVPAQGAEDVDLNDPALFLNRELGMLDFQERVLEEAWDETNPLLERVKFLAILASNMSEFFMVRIAGLKQQVAAGVSDRSADGRTPADTLVAAREQGFELMQKARRCLGELLPQLAEAGVRIYDYDELEEAQRIAAADYFEEHIFPVLTPLAFDPGRPFPFISNLSLSLAVVIHDPRKAEGKNSFARVKVPATLPRFVPVGPPDGVAEEEGQRCYDLVWTEQIIAAHMGRLFPGFEVLGSWPFRITRDAEMEIQELEADDLLETMAAGVHRRRFGHTIRCSIVKGTPDFVRDTLVENLELDPADMLELERPLGTSRLSDLLDLDRPDLKDPPFTPVLPSAFDDDVDIFAAIRKHDTLLHRPYESFTPVLQLFRQAARDPNVVAIKSTLYRVGRNSPVVKALLAAARNGKEVAVLVELKARFDEEPNIEWAKALEAEGVHVVYGLVGLKTHSKIAMVVRREDGHIRRYLHVGTGNYNASTAKLYTDLDYLTCNEDFGADASEAFNGLTGYATIDRYRRFLVAPRVLRPRMEELIRREIEHARKDGSGHLRFKMNALVDKKMIKLLYQASMAGVRCDLLVRGICCLRPGLPGVSENIRVVSIVGRFLEHSRIYWFNNGGDPEVYLGSADLMPRNLNRRVEIVFPVMDADIEERLRTEILETYWQDNVQARVMQPDGTYDRRTPAEDEEPLDAQEWFLAYHKKKAVARRRGNR